MKKESKTLQRSLNAISYGLLYMHMTYEEVELKQLDRDRKSDDMYYIDEKMFNFLRMIKSIGIDNVMNDLGHVYIKTLAESKYCKIDYESSIIKEYPLGASF